MASDYSQALIYLKRQGVSDIELSILRKQGQAAVMQEAYARGYGDKIRGVGSDGRLPSAQTEIVSGGEGVTIQTTRVPVITVSPAIEAAVRGDVAREQASGLNQFTSGEVVQQLRAQRGQQAALFDIQRRPEGSQVTFKGLDLRKEVPVEVNQSELNYTPLQSGMVQQEQNFTPLPPQYSPGPQVYPPVPKKQSVRQKYEEFIMGGDKLLEETAFAIPRAAKKLVFLEPLSASEKSTIGFVVGGAALGATGPVGATIGLVGGAGLGGFYFGKKAFEFYVERSPKAAGEAFASGLLIAPFAKTGVDAIRGPGAAARVNKQIPKGTVISEELFAKVPPSVEIRGRAVERGTVLLEEQIGSLKTKMRFRDSPNVAEEIEIGLPKVRMKTTTGKAIFKFGPLETIPPGMPKPKAIALIPEYAQTTAATFPEVQAASGQKLLLPQTGQKLVGITTRRGGGPVLVEPKAFSQAVQTNNLGQQFTLKTRYQQEANLFELPSVSEASFRVRALFGLEGRSSAGQGSFTFRGFRARPPTPAQQLSLDNFYTAPKQLTGTTRGSLMGRYMERFGGILFGSKGERAGVFKAQRVYVFDSAVPKTFDVFSAFPFSVTTSAAAASTTTKPRNDFFEAPSPTGQVTLLQPLLAEQKQKQQAKQKQVIDLDALFLKALQRRQSQAISRQQGVATATVQRQAQKQLLKDLQGQRQSVAQGQRQFQRTAQLEGQQSATKSIFARLRTRQRGATAQAFNTKQAQRTRQSTLAFTSVASATATRAAQKQATKAFQLEAQAQRTGQIVGRATGQAFNFDFNFGTPSVTGQIKIPGLDIPKRPPRVPGRPGVPQIPGVPEIPRTPPPDFGLRKGSNVSLFDVFVRRRGRFERVNHDPLPRGKAFSLGADKAQSTAARTFKVVFAETKQTKDPITDVALPNLDEFYTKDGLFIERSRSAINRRGEFAEITAKGIGAARRKKRKTKIKR